jgi:hypothetical protein
MRIADPTAAVRYLAAHPTDRILAYDDDVTGVYFVEIRPPQDPCATVVTIPRSTWIDLIARRWITRSGRYPVGRDTLPDGTDVLIHRTIFKLTPAGRAVGRTPEESLA